MLSLFKKMLFGPPKNVQPPSPTKIEKEIQFLVFNRGESIEKNKWYRMSHWNSSHYLKMEIDTAPDWKVFSNEENVVGVTYEDRDVKFLKLCDQDGFKIMLEKEPENPVDPYAIKVMATAFVDGSFVKEQLGYLPKETASLLKDEPEIDACPHSVYLPVDGRKFGLRIRILIRTKNYKKKNYGDLELPEPKKKKFVPPPWTEEDDINLDSIYEELRDKDVCEGYGIKKPTKSAIKKAVLGLHQEGLSSEKAFEQFDRVVERLIKINPSLEDY